VVRIHSPRPTFSIIYDPFFTWRESAVDRNEDAGSSADNRYDPLMDSSSIKENGMNKDLQRTEHNAPTQATRKQSASIWEIDGVVTAFWVATVR
jgi:hypothetical protein